MAPRGPDMHCITPRVSVPPVAQGAMSTLDLAASVARDVVAATKEILDSITWPPLVNEADRPPVDQVADAALWECFQKHLAATPQSTSADTESHTSAFDHLGHRAPAPSQEDQWAPRPEMMPRKVDRGWQPNCEEHEPSWATSQKRQSQSRPCDEVDPKKG